MERGRNGSYIRKRPQENKRKDENTQKDAMNWDGVPEERKPIFTTMPGNAEVRAALYALLHFA